MMTIGNYAWVLYTVFATLGVLLAAYGVALLVEHRSSRTKATPKGAQRTPGKGRDIQAAAG
jgi:hypothetical protein